jgi:hypothetical protein
MLHDDADAALAEPATAVSATTAIAAMRLCPLAILPPLLLDFSRISTDLY